MHFFPFSFNLAVLPPPLLHACCIFCNVYAATVDLSMFTPPDIRSHNVLSLYFVGRPRQCEVPQANGCLQARHKSHENDDPPVRASPWRAQPRQGGLVLQNRRTIDTRWGLCPPHQIRRNVRRCPHKVRGRRSSM